jgi:hypothetical protein
MAVDSATVLDTTFASTTGTIGRTADLCIGQNPTWQTL